jgi:hypothetical protein
MYDEIQSRQQRKQSLIIEDDDEEEDGAAHENSRPDEFLANLIDIIQDYGALDWMPSVWFLEAGAQKPQQVLLQACTTGNRGNYRKK